MPSELKFQLNGKETAVSSETGRSLLEVIREDLKMTGTGTVSSRRLRDATFCRTSSNSEYATGVTSSVSSSDSD